MAGLALLGGRLAFFHRCVGHHRLHRLLGLLGGGRPRGARLLGRDRVAGLGRLLGRENGAGPDIERERDQAGTEDRAKDLVELEGIHRIEAPEENIKPAGDGFGANSAPRSKAADRYRFASRLATRISAAALSTFVQVRQMPDTIILIPARMASTRLPGKPLADIAGLPMIVHVLRRAQAAKIGEAVVATDSEAVAAAVEKSGGRAIMTRADHVSGSDRIYEALEALDPERRIGVVVNVQGDLPSIEPADIRAALGPLSDLAVDIATLAAFITDKAELSNPNVVKAIGAPATSGRFRATTFTRADASGPGSHYHLSLIHIS